MRTPPGHLYAAKCACCHAEAIMECVECLRSGQDEAGPSFCSAACLKKHFGQHRQKRCAPLLLFGGPSRDCSGVASRMFAWPVHLAGDMLLA